MFTPEESIAEFERIIKEADKAYDSMMDDFTVYGAKIILKYRTGTELAENVQRTCEREDHRNGGLRWAENKLNAVRMKLYMF